MSRLSSSTTLVAVVCLVLLIISLYELNWLQNEHMRYHHDMAEKSQTLALHTSKPSSYPLHTNNINVPVFVPFGRNVDSGFLKHVFDTFTHFGYVRKDLNTTNNWDVLWAHDYPFSKLSTQLHNLHSNKKVNHFPGSGYITNKMDLATSNIPFVPKAFKIPQQNKQLMDYASKNSHKMFVQKGNDHRGIKIEKIEKLDLKQNDSFVQEFVDNPLLVDGHKFDIGVYTIITSIDPLIVYIYNGDILFRYCPEKYYPFDPNKVDKYVVGDDYLPTWEVPSLKRYFNNFGYNMRDSFNAFMKESGKNPDKIWNQVEEAIRIICLYKESAIQKVLSSYPSKRNFFEMVRFDFVVDDKLNVYVMEANMSPNLSSAHFPPNRILYEQVLFSLFSLVGLASFAAKMSHEERDDIEVSDRSIMVYQQECFINHLCKDCLPPECQLCQHCLMKSGTSIKTLKQAYNEHVRKRDCKRIFPPSLNFESVNATDVPDDLTPENQFLFRWFKAKCLMDQSWC
ncbi:tubulin tyrosine ligase-like 15 [Lycorma delicatula]|uniref:tubulin tyrosine ligase-like 15 n=1 Tax=Lycorma delicatula TaxID=130591 RepID=UPI003F5153C7